MGQNNNGAESQDEAPFLSQAWLYRFYETYEKRLNPVQRSIMDHTLIHMDHPLQSLRDCEARDKLKIATLRIVRRYLQQDKAGLSKTRHQLTK